RRANCFAGRYRRAPLSARYRSLTVALKLYTYELASSVKNNWRTPRGAIAAGTISRTSSRRPLAGSRRHTRHGTLVSLNTYTLPLRAQAAPRRPRRAPRRGRRLARSRGGGAGLAGRGERDDELAVGGPPPRRLGPHAFGRDRPRRPIEILDVDAPAAAGLAPA